MGSNMMRQAVPLLRTDAPIVGTGLEPHLARDSRTMINAEGNGVITYVDANTIKVKYKKSEEEKLISFDEAVKINKKSCEDNLSKTVGTLLFKEWEETDYGHNHEDWKERRDEILKLDLIA